MENDHPGIQTENVSSILALDPYSSSIEEHLGGPSTEEHLVDDSLWQQQVTRMGGHNTSKGDIQVCRVRNGWFFRHCLYRFGSSLSD